MTVTRARIFSLFVLAVVSAMLLSACGNPGSIAARIDEDEVSKEELATAVGVYRSIYVDREGACGIADPLAEPDPSACERAVLGDLVLAHIAEVYALANDIEVSSADVDDAMATLEEGTDTDQLREAFAANGVTRDDLVDLIRSSLLQRAVVEAVTLEELGEEGLRDRYDDRLADFSTIELDHILVASEGEARDVYATVTEPGFSRKDFRGLAKEVSTDPGVVENGGTYGPASAADFDPAFAAGALALEPGEISEPVQTQFGWHVIRLESKDVPPFEQVRDELLGLESGAVFGDWLRERVEAATIEVNPGLGRYDPETFTVVRIDSTDTDADSTAPAPSAAAGG